MATSILSNKEIKNGEAVKGEEIREGIFELIKKDNPEFNSESLISIDELNHYRRLYFINHTEKEKGELDALEVEVMTAIRENSILSENIQEEIKDSLTTGQKMADKIAAFGGSWTFILTFFAFIVFWMFINVWLLATKAFDPYPFILLNLILSCLAAIQAPIIMMSQNRQEQKDRQRSEHDYKINLKAELEIKLLNDKIDHLLVQQNQKLIEIQKAQINYLEDVIKRLNNKQTGN